MMQIKLKIAVVTSLKIQPDTTKKTVVKQTLLDQAKAKKQKSIRIIKQLKKKRRKEKQKLIK